MSNIITQSVADVFRRPADASFNDMGKLLEVSEQEMNQSRVIPTRAANMSFSVSDEGQFNVEVDGRPFPLTNFSLTQVAQMAKLPTHVLENLHRRQRDDLVVENLKTLFPNDRAKNKFILVRDHYGDDGSINSVARAINGGDYSRLWDYEVFSEMEDLLMDRGFTPRLPELMPHATRSGFMHGLHTGLFRGDQCSFGFFFLEDESLKDCEDLGGLVPGMLVWNSEVGARSFGYHTFYYHEASGSIVIWTPAKHKRKRFVHRGNVKKAFKEYLRVLEDVAENFKQRFEDAVEVFENAAYTPFALDAGRAIEKLNKSHKMSAVEAKATIAAARRRENSFGQPLSIWNVALGICWEAAQTSRAEVLVDKSLVATKLMFSLV